MHAGRLYTFCLLQFNGLKQHTIVEKGLKFQQNTSEVIVKLLFLC